MSGIMNSQIRGGNNNESRNQEGCSSKFQKMELTFSVVMEVSVISAKIGSIHGSADEGLVGAESNAWDSNPMAKVDCDVMLDNYEGTRLES